MYDQLRDKLDVAFDDLSDQQVKNIARPVHVWRDRLAAETDGIRTAGSKRSSLRCRAFAGFS